MKQNLALYRVQDGERIGTLSVTDTQLATFKANCQGAEQLHRLGSIPHGWYDLDTEYQDTHEDSGVFVA